MLAPGEMKSYVPEELQEETLRLQHLQEHEQVLPIKVT